MNPFAEKKKKKVKTDPPSNADKDSSLRCERKEQRYNPNRKKNLFMSCMGLKTEYVDLVATAKNAILPLGSTYLHNPERLFIPAVPKTPSENQRLRKLIAGVDEGFPFARLLKSTLFATKIVLKVKKMHPSVSAAAPKEAKIPIFASSSSHDRSMFTIEH
ncbi:hypothetical protein CEXT_58201 [Caerostris extrusa]|uniref:Uncharacterized protein n=1 Tax=Caerostris extrusa TaxID=172846 RepID=A0AAV4MBQ3_CAEEX|nr:hypothetical protein CEXT_58201 [Caerostris extrusa]